jgi:hypothetical protein
MELKILDAIFSEYPASPGRDASDLGEIDRFHRFLLAHGGFRKLEVSGHRPRILDPAGSLRCFHFSQYLDWYLPEREGMGEGEVAAARASLERFNAWLLESGIIGADDFEENRESIRGVEEGSPVSSEAFPVEEGGVPSPAEEQDFHVPGEYLEVLSGEFVITKVQEGILYGRRDADSREIGPILVDRPVSAGSRPGDRVHLSVGRAGSHWNLLTSGRHRE